MVFTYGWLGIWKRLSESVINLKPNQPLCAFKKAYKLSHCDSTVNSRALLFANRESAQPWSEPIIIHNPATSKCVLLYPSTFHSQLFTPSHTKRTLYSAQTILDMSAQRVLAPLTSSSSFLYRFASSPATSPLRPCQHVLRTFSSSQNSRMSSKRKMQTSTAYQPYSLGTNPPPPRNVGIPDTSIAGGIPQVNETRPPKQTGQYEIDSSRPAEQKSSIILTEQEAQKSKPTAQTTTQTRAKPRPKLRARKAAMHLTPGAVSQLRNLLSQPDPKLIKVGVRNRGCSGLAYHLEYVEKPGAFDEEVEQDGVKVLIDSKALFSIIGSEMDWVEDKLNQRFVFRNPNISKFLLSQGHTGIELIVWQRNNADAANPLWFNERIHLLSYYTPPRVSVALALGGVLDTNISQH